MKNKNLKPVCGLLRNLDESSLKNPVVVADLVRAFGIVCWGPAVFGDDEQFKNHVTEVVGIYQTPDQIAKALVFLSDFKINSYLEVGVFQGGNFLFVSEYLKRFNPEIKCLGVDPTNYLNPEIREITELSDWIRFASVTSDKLSGREYDLVFIDGDHSAEGVKRDWEAVGEPARICMLHDIQEASCPAVVSLWDDLKRTSKKGHVEFLESRNAGAIQGIGILYGRKTKS